jgi:hypothetical protein
MESCHPRTTAVDFDSLYATSYLDGKKNRLIRRVEMDYLFFAISVIVIYTAGYKTAKKQFNDNFEEKVKPLIVRAFHVGIQQSIILMDRKLLEFGRKKGIEIPVYEFTVNGMKIQNIKEIERKKLFQTGG